MQEWNYSDKYQTSQVPLKTKYIDLTMDVSESKHKLEAMNMLNDKMDQFIQNF